MKKTVLFLMAAMISVAMISCGGKKEEAKDEKKSEKQIDASTPEGLVEAYLVAQAALDFKKQKELVTKESVSSVELGESLAKGVFGDDLESMKQEIEVKNIKCTINEDKAECTCEVLGKSQTIQLVKEDGKWKVDLMSFEGMGENTDSLSTEEPVAE